MAAAIASIYVPRPGGGAELRALLLDAADYLSKFGEGRSQVRVTWLGGEEAGRYLLRTLYPSVKAQMDGFDRIIADVASNPLAAFAAADAPGTVVSRFTLHTLDVDAPRLEAAAIETNCTFSVAVGKRAEAVAAVAAAERRHQDLGATAQAWEVRDAGAGSGLIVFVTSTSSYADLAELRARNAALGQPGPITAAVDAGVLIPASESSTLRLTRA